jgi:hypothetical protein
MHFFQVVCYIHWWFNKCYFFPGCVLHSLKTSKILSADVGYKGTQLKISLELEGGQKVAFKPKM